MHEMMRELLLYHLFEPLFFLPVFTIPPERHLPGKIFILAEPRASSLVVLERDGVVLLLDFSGDETFPG